MKTSSLILLGLFTLVSGTESQCFNSCLPICTDCKFPGCYCNYESTGKYCVYWCLQEEMSLTQCVQNRGSCHYLGDGCDSVCRDKLLGDGKCDPECNVAACEYDAGDCPVPDPDTTEPDATEVVFTPLDEANPTNRKCFNRRSGRMKSRVRGVKSLDECKAACDDSCKAIHYKDGRRPACWVWDRVPAGTRPGRGHSCLVKSEV